MTLRMVPMGGGGRLSGLLLRTLISVAVTPGWAKATPAGNASGRSSRPPMRRIGWRIVGPPWPSAERDPGGAVVVRLNGHRGSLGGRHGRASPLDPADLNPAFLPLAATRSRPRTL